jgi:hypothetical protein
MGGRVLNADRRAAPRRTPAPDEPLSRLRLRVGRDLAVIDLSHRGALVEGAARLLPGTHCEVHVVTGDGRQLVRTRIVRAWVCHVDAGSVRYRAGLAFDHTVDTSPVGYAIPDALVPAAASPGSPYHEIGAGHVVAGINRVVA